MVEKIVVNPREVRGYGNVVGEKTKNDLDLYESYAVTSSDIIDNISVGIIRMVYMDPNLFFSFNIIEKYLYVNSDDVELSFSNKALVLEGTGFEIGFDDETKELWVDELQTTISIVLSAGSSSVTIGSNVTLSATVTDDGSPVSGVSVTFRLGSTTIGTATTSSSGVATYTYATATAGTNTFTASYDIASSNAVNVTVNKKTATASLSASPSTTTVGNNVTLTGTIKYNNSGISGIPVTFKEGSTVVGTGTTNSSGVATCTVSNLSVGSHGFTVESAETDMYSGATSSSVTVTVLDHSYSLAFSQASYVATGGSATLEMTLLDNNVPVEGATISVSGSDSSLYTGITNAAGKATFTVSGLSSDTTFTASYSNVSDTCTVNVPTYLFYDACDSSTGLSQYGASECIRGSNASFTMTYNATENAYECNGSGNYHAYIPILALKNEDNYTIEAEFKTKNVQYNAIGFYLDNYGDTTSYGQSIYLTCYSHEFIRRLYRKSSDGSYNAQRNNNILCDTWYRISMTVDGSSFSFKLYDMQGNLMNSDTTTYSIANKSMGILLFCEKGLSNSICYVRNIVAESL